MALSLTSRAYGYIVVAGGALVGAVALQDAPLAALGIAPLIAAMVGIATDATAIEHEVTAEVRQDRDVINAGETVRLAIVLRARRPVARCRVSLICPAESRLDQPPCWLVSLPGGVPVEVTAKLATSHPGAIEIGPVVLETSGRSGLLQRRVVASRPTRIYVRALEESLRSLPRSMRVRVTSGDRIARSRGDGIELAEVRPELPGERAKRINWRATARRGATHVTLRHPEQSTDVVLFADTFDDPAMTRVLEVAAGAAAGYLSHRDRVGLVCFGGILDWVEAGTGRRQLDRIRARLAATAPFFSYAWKTIERIPPRALPTGALVIAISPLRDDRFTSAVAEVRGRGHEVVVVEIADAERAPRADDSPSLEAALLLSRMEREDLRHRLWLHGIAVAPLLPSDPLEAVFAVLSEVRRRMRPGARR